MAEHKHGTMDITNHEKDFSAFVKFSTRVGILAICVVVFIGIVNG